MQEELVKGEHFILLDLLKAILGSSSQEGTSQEPQVEIAEGALVSFVQSEQSPLVVQDSKPTPQAAKKKKTKIKAAVLGLEGFVDWVDPIASDSVEERGDDMSSLDAGFVAQICKQFASAQGETSPCSKVSGEKHSRRSGLDEEAQRSPAVITTDCPERASDTLPA